MYVKCSVVSKVQQVRNRLPILGYCLEWLHLHCRTFLGKCKVTLEQCSETDSKTCSMIVLFSIHNNMWFCAQNVQSSTCRTCHLLRFSMYHGLGYLDKGKQMCENCHYARADGSLEDMYVEHAVNVSKAWQVLDGASLHGEFSWLESIYCNIWTWRSHRESHWTAYEILMADP